MMRSVWTRNWVFCEIQYINAIPPLAWWVSIDMSSIALHLYILILFVFVCLVIFLFQHFHIIISGYIPVLYDFLCIAPFECFLFRQVQFLYVLPYFSHWYIFRYFKYLQPFLYYCSFGLIVIILQ